MVPRSVSYQQNLPWYSLQPHSMQFTCTLYRNTSANVLCGDKALNIKLQKGQRGMHWERSVFSCSPKSCIATDERDTGRQRRPLHAHTNSHFMEPPYLCFPRVVCAIVEGGRSSERLAEAGLFREWGRTEEKLRYLTCPYAHGTAATSTGSTGARRSAAGRPLSCNICWLSRSLSTCSCGNPPDACVLLKHTFCSFGFPRTVISAMLSQYICNGGSIKVLVLV